MNMLRTTLLAAASTMMLVPAAQAQYSYSGQHSYAAQNCESQRQGRQVAGALVGAVLGGVIGAEIGDSSNDRDRYRGYRGRGWDRHGRHGGRYYRDRNRGNDSNDLAIVAGAGIGALVGAGVASGNPCPPARDPYYGRNQYGGQYGDPYGRQPAGYDGGYQGYDTYGRNDGYGNDGYGRNDGYAYAEQPYAPNYGREGLAGAPDSYTYTQPDYSGGARVYSATSVSGSCRWMQSRSQNSYGQVTTNDVYMCQGSDGIWRPAQ